MAEKHRVLIVGADGADPGILSRLIAGEESELTRLALVNKRMPYVGHKPLRYAGIKLYERALQMFSGNPLH